MVEERIQVKGGQQGRCPFCHDEVPLDQRVACLACLAAHHAACWDEHGKCSTCGEEEALRRNPGAAARSAEPTPTPQPIPAAAPQAPRPATHPWQVEAEAAERRRREYAAEAERSEGYAWQVDPSGPGADRDLFGVIISVIAIGIALVVLGALTATN